MTDEAKALVERLRGDWPEILVEKHWMMDSDAIDKQREEAADLIETQAREIERLNTILSEMNDTDVIARTMTELAKFKALAETLAGALGEAITWNSHDDEGVPAVWLDQADVALRQYKEARDAS